MWIVALAWIYVVGLMAVAEIDQSGFVAGTMTFLAYCVVPLSILYYLTGSKRRRARRAANDPGYAGASADGASGPAARHQQGSHKDHDSDGDSGSGDSGGGGDGGGGGD